MGRPIKKSRLVGGANDFGGDLSGKIAVTAFRTGGSTTSSTVAYIVKQKGSKRFKIHMDDSTEDTFTLVAKAPAALDTNGTLCVQVILNDSTVSFVEKFYNRTVHLVDSDGTTTRRVTYTLGSEGTDEEKAGAGVGSIDVR